MKKEPGTISECTEALITNRAALDARQAQIDAKVRPRYSHNRTHNSGWTVPGNGAWSQAVGRAGLEYCSYWSGSLPTPSTQYPLAYAEFLLRRRPALVQEDRREYQDCTRSPLAKNESDHKRDTRIASYTADTALLLLLLMADVITGKEFEEMTEALVEGYARIS
jgi:hypothetical protein